MEMMSVLDYLTSFPSQMNSRNEIACVLVWVSDKSVCQQAIDTVFCPVAANMHRLRTD